LVAAAATTTLILRSKLMTFMYEALARERMREQRDRAAHVRMMNQLVSARRWHRIAAFSARRAARSDRRLAEHSAHLHVVA